MGQVLEGFWRGPGYRAIGDDPERLVFTGGPRGARTHDPRIKSPMLYQLS